MFQQDAINANNPQYCIEYVTEIFEHLISSENKLLPCSTYMDTVCPVVNPPALYCIVGLVVLICPRFQKWQQQCDCILFCVPCWNSNNDTPFRV